MNVLYQPLFDEINGYPINTDFRIGIQISILMDDKELTERERMSILIDLLFVAKIPDPEELKNILHEYMTGWCMDRTPAEKKKLKLMDYDVDQWRIFADFMQIYHIDLNEIEYMHWWKFQALLWNMPAKLSSFMQVISIRSKKIEGKMSNKEKKAIREAQRIYALDQPKNPASNNLTEEEKVKIDEFDKIQAQRKMKRKIAEDFKH